MLSRKTIKLTLLTSLFALGNCADTLLTTEGFAGKPPGGTPLSATVTKSLGNGIFETEIDATSYSAWAYFDFEAQNQVAVTDPATNSAWDIGFKRFMVKLNGGASGAAGVTVVALNGDDFTARTQAPSPFTPETTDVPDVGDANDACRPTTSGVLFALLNSMTSPSACWFAYATGVLTTRDISYVIKTATPRYFKLKMLSYYGPTGTSGKIRFQWGEVTAP
jgi:hypothetical protein